MGNLLIIRGQLELLELRRQQRRRLVSIISLTSYVA